MNFMMTALPEEKIVWPEAGKAPLRGCGGRAVSLSYKESKPGPSFPELETKRPANQCHNPHRITTSHATRLNRSLRRGPGVLGPP